MEQLSNTRFEMPAADVIMFAAEDVITTSGDPNELPGVDPFAFFGDEE